nr:MAG TPA: hypothetical protein [Caudoviricetes sp.]
MCCLIYKFLLILTQKMQISFLKILPENALKFVSKKMRICVKNFAQLQHRSSIFHKRKNENMGEVVPDYLCDVWQFTSRQFVGKSCGQPAHK